MPTSYDTQLISQEQPFQDLSEQLWQQILDLLPADYEQQARTQKAFLRAVGFRCPGDLLRGLLASAFCLNSYRQVSSWATSTGLSSNGDRSWAKRSRQSRDWLFELVRSLLYPLEQETPQQLELPERFSGRIHLVDATSLRSWKRTGECRRMHTSYDLLSCRIEHVFLTDQHTSEKLSNFAMTPGDIWVGDAAYCRRQAILDLVDQQAHVVTRLHWASCPLHSADGTPFDLSGWLKTCKEQKIQQAEMEVWIQVKQQRTRLRLVARSLGEEATKRARRKQRKQAHKQGSKIQPLSEQVAGWILVLTSLQAKDWPAETVLALYRARWQIELLFKRIKQLMRTHRLRSRDLNSNQAVLAALLVGWILMEKQARQIRQRMREQANKTEKEREEETPLLISNWHVCATLLNSLRTMILGPWTWQQILAKVEQITQVLLSHPQNRMHQATEILSQLNGVLVKLEV